MPKFWIQVDRMTQSHHFHQHVQANGVWWPPRPLGSNILRAGETTGRWYYYDGQQTRQVNAPATSTVTPYKTYSFYFDHQLIWVYTGDATIEQVGDGSGNPRVPRPGDYDDEDDEEDDEDGQGDNSSDEPDDPDENTSDWKIMHFDWPADNTYTSSVTARGEHPNLRLQGRDQPWVEQLIPERYFAAPNYRVLAARPHNFGGMTGELPIMIALIAFSVRSNQVHAALTHCIRQAYNPHDIGQRGDGWIHRRGIVVRIYHQRESETTLRRLRDARQASARQALQLMERGDYGKFFS